MSRSPFLRAALDAAARGWKVFPVIPDGKTPAIGDWQRRASGNRRQIYGWWADNSRKNIGIATDPSGVVVIDLDDSHGATAPEPFAGARNGQEVLTRLAAQAGAEIPTDTFTVLTPSVIHGNPAWGQHCLPRPEPVAVDIVTSELSTGAQQRDVATAAWRAVFRLARRMGGGER